MNEINNSTNDLILSPLYKRFFAFLIDDILVSVIIFTIFWDSIANSASDMESMVNVVNGFVMPILFLKFIYQTLFIWYYGATVGKIIVKIKVIDYNTYERVALGAAILRSFGRILSEMFFYLGFLFALLNDGKQTFHDKISRTLVVNV